MTNASANRAARPWLASLLSLAQLGLGHLYVWKPRQALIIWASALALSAPLALGASSPRGAIAGLSYLLLLLAYVGTAVHAYRAALSQTAARPGRLRLLAAMVVSLIVVSLVAVPYQSWIKRHVAEAFRIPSMAMEPTLLPGDWLFVRPIRAPVARDELYTFRTEGTVFLKRLVGLGGDTLAMRAGHLYRNSRLMSEPYVQQTGESYGDDSAFRWQAAHLATVGGAATYRPSADDWGPIVVPANATFFLGDNRDLSRDSRFYGFIPRDSVIGTPTRIYFSYSDEDLVRWERIGRVRSR